MYLAVLSVILGQALLLRALLLVGYGLLFWGVVHRFVVFVEKPSLRGQFGDRYVDYLRRVPWWIPQPGNRS
jgi:protein-S-isoprenylcysteine O-methyltransferase Ste14